MNIYLELTQDFNRGRLRTIICSGQAVVLHRLAIMSKDGDWILREDEEALTHVLSVLQERGATYRFGAPLDLRWLRGGWSSHLEFKHGPLRVRTDFFTRPPRLSHAVLSELWQTQKNCHPPFVGLRELAELKKTNREKDYAVIGELARKLVSVEDQLLYSRSARDLLEIKKHHPATWEKAENLREALRFSSSLEDLETSLDKERRMLIRQNELRLDRYEKASSAWAGCWLQIQKRTEGLSLTEAHAILTEVAEDVLPYEP